MPIFVMLSTLGPQGSATLREHPDRLRHVNVDVEAMGVTILHQYALLGQWDFVTVIEAPDQATMAKVATTLSARGTLKTQTLAALTVEELITALGEGTG